MDFPGGSDGKESACNTGVLSHLVVTLWDPMDCCPPGSSVLGDSPGRNTRVGCCALLQGIFPTQGSNPGLQNCRRILYHLSHQGSPTREPMQETWVQSLGWEDPL